MVFSRRPIQWKGHSRLTRARCFLGKQSSPLPTAAEHEVVEAPLATKEDDIPNQTHHAFQSTIQTLRKRTRKKSSSIERRDAESTQVAVAMGEKEEKNAAMDKVNDCKPVHKYDEVMSLKPTDTDSFETTPLKSVIQQQPVQLVCEVMTEAKPTVMPKSFESMHRRTQTKQVTRESPGLSIITSEFPDDSLEPSFEVDLHEQPLSVVVLQEPAIPNTIEVVFESNPAERKVNITPSSYYDDDNNYDNDRNAHLSVNNDVKDLPEAVGTTTYEESGAVNAKGESEILPRIGSNEKEQSAQMAPAVIESQENEPHPVFQQQAAQNRSFATFNETAPPSAAAATTGTAAAVNSLPEIGGCGGLTTIPSRSKPELSLTISRQEADVAVDADSYLKQDLEVNTDDDLGRHKSEECVVLKSDVESETQSAYFSTYYNPTTPPSPDTIIEVDPDQFNAEVCQAMKDFDEDALSRPQSCLLTECLSDNDTSNQRVTFVVEPERRASRLPIESCSVSRDDHSIHDGVVVPSDCLLSDDANHSDIGIVSNHPWVAKANKDIKDANDVTNLGTVICGDGSVEVNDLWSRNNSDSKDAISDLTDHYFSSNKSNDATTTTTAAAAEAVNSSFDEENTVDSLSSTLVTPVEMIRNAPIQEQIWPENKASAGSKTTESHNSMLQSNVMSYTDMNINSDNTVVEAGDDDLASQDDDDSPSLATTQGEIVSTECLTKIPGELFHPPLLLLHSTSLSPTANALTTEEQKFTDTNQSISIVPKANQIETQWEKASDNAVSVQSADQITTLLSDGKTFIDAANDVLSIKPHNQVDATHPKSFITGNIALLETKENEELCNPNNLRDSEPSYFEFSKENHRVGSDSSDTYKVEQFKIGNENSLDFGADCNAIDQTRLKRSKVGEAAVEECVSSEISKSSSNAFADVSETSIKGVVAEGTLEESEVLMNDCTINKIQSSDLRKCSENVETRFENKISEISHEGLLSRRDNLTDDYLLDESTLSKAGGHSYTTNTNEPARSDDLELVEPKNLKDIEQSESNNASKVPQPFDQGIFISCGRVVRDFEREAKTRCNF